MQTQSWSRDVTKCKQVAKETVALCKRIPSFYFEIITISGRNEFDQASICRVFSVHENGSEWRNSCERYDDVSSTHVEECPNADSGELPLKKLSFSATSIIIYLFTFSRNNMKIRWLEKFWLSFKMTSQIWRHSLRMWKMLLVTREKN